MQAAVKRTKRHFDFGDQFGHLLSPILSRNLATAAASCRFTIQGPNSVGDTAKNWGTWIRTNIQTDGERPQCRHAWQIQKSGWISGDSHEAANVILDCFGLTIDHVFEHYGAPEWGVVYHVDLADVIAALAPEIMQAPRAVKTA